VRRAAFALFAASAALAVPAGAAEPVRVYALELDSRLGHDRLLIFADATLAFEVDAPEPETRVVRLRGAELDPAAPRHLAPPLGGAVTRIRAFDHSGPAGPEVQVVIGVEPPVEPRVSQRGGMLALDFPRPQAREGVDMRFREASFDEVIERVAGATGERFILDERLQGTVTIMVPDRVGPEEALELLHAALLLKNMTAVPGPEGVRKILPVGEAASAARRGTVSDEIGSGEALVTLLPLRAADARELAADLEPYAGESSLVLPYEPGNSLILAGSELRLQRLIALARLLDTSSEEMVIVRRPRHRGAAELGALLAPILEARAGPTQRVVLASVTHTNSLLIRAPRDLREEIDARIADLDRPALEGGRVQVVPVRYTDPESLAELLRGLAAGDPAAEGRARTTGLAGQPFALALDAESRTLLLAGEAATLARVREVVDQLDREPRRVFVELLVLEIQADDSLELGFDALFNHADEVLAQLALNPSGGGLVQPGTEGAPAGAARYTGPEVLIPVFDEGGNPIGTVPVARESVVITAEARLIEARVLQRPHLLVASGDEQQIFVGENIPIPVQRADATDPLQVEQNIQRQDVGLTLRVRPTLGVAGRVQLELFAEISRLGPSLAGDVDEVGPTVRKRTIETVLPMRDGVWAVVGLGYQPEVQEQVVGTPFLRDIPVLGFFFRTTRERSLKSHLVIAARAEVVPSRDEQLAETLRRRLAFERSMARAGRLDPQADGPVAVLVTTREVEAGARSIADAFAAEGRAVRVLEWSLDGAPRYDVYLTGFESLPEAASAAAGLVDEGFGPELVPVRGAEPEPSSFHEPGASVPPTSPF